MAVTARQIAMVGRLERAAMRRDYLPIRKRQAEAWCAVHVAEDWYLLPVMLMSKGCNGDYSAWMEIAPDSAYELDDTGCYVVMADWWTSFQLWRRDWAKGRGVRPRKPRPDERLSPNSIRRRARLLIRRVEI